MIERDAGQGIRVARKVVLRVQLMAGVRQLRHSGHDGDGASSLRKRPRAPSLDDLLQAGNEGLLEPNHLGNHALLKRVPGLGRSQPSTSNDAAYL